MWDIITRIGSMPLDQNKSIGKPVWVLLELKTVHYLFYAGLTSITMKKKIPFSLQMWIYLAILGLAQATLMYFIYKGML